MYNIQILEPEESRPRKCTTYNYSSQKIQDLHCILRRLSSTSESMTSMDACSDGWQEGHACGDGW